MLTTACQSPTPTVEATTPVAAEPDITQTVAAAHEGPKDAAEQKLATEAERISAFDTPAVIVRLAGSPADIPLTIPGSKDQKLIGMSCSGPQNIRIEFIQGKTEVTGRQTVACGSAFSVPLPDTLKTPAAIRIKSIQGTITTVALAGPTGT